MNISIGNTISRFSAVAPATDYLSNLWDEWVATERIIADANNLDIDSWSGYRNNTQLTVLATTEDIPSNREITLTTEGQGFSLPSNPGINATDVTFCYLIKKNGLHAEASGIFLFDSNDPVPRFIIQFEISAANPNMGIQYNGVQRDFGAQFPVDNQYHVLCVRIQGTEARAFVDGVQVGNTLTGLTGGSFAMNTSRQRSLLRGAGVINRTFKGQVKKIRIYLEALSNQNIALISNIANDFRADLTYRNVRVFNGCGQSLMSGSGVWGTLPSNLQGELARCFIWQSNTRTWLPVSSTNYTLNSPLLSFCYEISIRYPSDDIFFIMGAVGGTNMDSWLPPSGINYTNNRTRSLNALTALQIQVRNIVQRGGLWMHGQTDSEDAGLSASYGGKESTFFTNWRTDFGHTIIPSGRVRTDYFPSPIANINTLNAGKQANADLDSNIKLFTDTYSLSGDNIHHDTQGNIDLGVQLASYF